MSGAGQLTNYDAACRAVAEAHRIDEVKDIRDKAVAMVVYAKQAKDGELIAHATAIRKRAERRLGELMEADRQAGNLKHGGPRVAKKPLVETLADQGVDKNLADRARKAAAMPAERFEEQIAKAVRAAVAATEGDAAVIKAVREEQQDEKRNRRAMREGELAAKILALPNKRYGVIVADPEWRFEPWSRETGMDRAADNHYPTSILDVIKARDVPSIAADDCVLFLWATVPMLPQALEVMAAWGFAYKSSCTWVKDRAGTGYWFRNQHELLLLGTRGNVPAPAPGTQWPSAIVAPAGEHSAKPEAFLEMIEMLFSDTAEDRTESSRSSAPRLGCLGQRSGGGGRMRCILPQRRRAETFQVIHWNQPFTVTVGFYRRRHARRSLCRQPQDRRRCRGDRQGRRGGDLAGLAVRRHRRGNPARRHPQRQRGAVVDPRRGG